MITLKASMFIVEYDETAINGYKVFIRKRDKYEDVTDSLTDDEKTELIGDLIYAVTDLVKERSKDAELENENEYDGCMEKDI